jgi:hypothetical protein
MRAKRSKSFEKKSSLLRKMRPAAAGVNHEKPGAFILNLVGHLESESSIRLDFLLGNPPVLRPVKALRRITRLPAWALDMTCLDE